MLISETHFTHRNYFSMPNYKYYQTKHPDGKAHGGTAIVVRANIRHYESNSFCSNHIQATTIMIQDRTGQLVVSVVYYPSKHTITKYEYITFLGTLGRRFIAGSDYNAKHPQWGFRLTKGRQLLLAMKTLELDIISTGQPSYWPAKKKSRRPNRSNRLLHHKRYIKEIFPLRITPRVVL